MRRSKKPVKILTQFDLDMIKLLLSEAKKQTRDMIHFPMHKLKKKMKETSSKVIYDSLSRLMITIRTSDKDYSIVDEMIVGKRSMDVGLNYHIYVGHITTEQLWKDIVEYTVE